VYAVILAGGGGTRLWPLSRRARPKPFLPLLGPVTLFRGTLERIAPLVGWGGIYVIAERQHAALVAAQAPELPAGHLLCEPQGRNTAAAIAYGALAIDRRPDEVMVVLPADHAIRDEATFRDVLRAAGERLATGALGVADPLVTLGIGTREPSGPETGYGYIRPRVAAGGEVGGLTAYPVEAFEEKPTEARARELTAMPGVSWNAGMFLWRRRAILDALGRYAPDVLAGVREALAAGGSGAPLATDAAAARYGSVRATSIDYAVMEPASRDGRVLMGALDVGWNDVGSWTAVREARAAATNPGDPRGDSGREAGAVASTLRHLDVGSERVFVESASGRLVVTLGLRDTIVVDTPDAILVCSADHAQDVRTIVERLTAAGETEYL
jgi:mannose-1-phosphate guanylyltransferase/mannose-6-phosphate isomerase